MKLLHIAAFLIALVLVTSCFKWRNLASESGPQELPPLVISNKAYAPGDEPPIVQTKQGFVTTNIPGVPPQPPKQHTYTTYVGPSN